MSEVLVETRIEIEKSEKALRNHFAGQALQSLIIAAPKVGLIRRVEMAYEYADAMMKESKK